MLELAQTVNSDYKIWFLFHRRKFMSPPRWIKRVMKVGTRAWWAFGLHPLKSSTHHLLIPSTHTFSLSEWHCLAFSVLSIVSSMWSCVLFHFLSHRLSPHLFPTSVLLPPCLCQTRSLIRQAVRHGGAVCSKDINRRAQNCEMQVNET